MHNRKLITLTAAAALMAGSATAMAQTDNSQTMPSGMSIGEIASALEDKGYTRIDSIDREMDRYEVDATDPNGQRVELTVDARSGEVLRSERDDD
ncbi:PepSY domain-containing protein [Salinisphaera sp. T31B1]|uniref:PepSY domain-containing protein n=1 Tax=Salinisphaera sp. T31B1 TaxID=727963 RepID=UPI0033416B5A